jgi:hypothetical protein
MENLVYWIEQYALVWVACCVPLIKMMLYLSFDHYEEWDLSISEIWKKKTLVHKAISHFYSSRENEILTDNPNV